MIEAGKTPEQIGIQGPLLMKKVLKKQLEALKQGDLVKSKRMEDRYEKIRQITLDMLNRANDARQRDQEVSINSRLRTTKDIKDIIKQIKDLKGK